MLGKIIEKLYRWHYKRTLKKQQKKKLNIEDKNRQLLYEQLRSVLKFVKWLNEKGLGNRHQKKSFWRAIEKGQPILETTLQRLINKYAKKDEKPIKAPEGQK